MGGTCTRMALSERQEIWGSSLLSPLFVEDDIESLGVSSVPHTALPGSSIISARTKIALLYDGKITAVVPQLGSVAFNVSASSKFTGVHIFAKGNLSVSRFFKDRNRSPNASSQFTIDTEEMLVSANATSGSHEFLLRFCMTKTNGNEVVIKSYRATSIQVLERSKLLALEKPSSALASNVYYLVNNVLNSDSLTLLRSVSFFADIADEKLLRLADLSTISVLAPGCVVFRENDEEGSEMFITLAGALEVSSNQSGQSIVLATLHAGSCFGEMALMTRVPRAATIKVLDHAMLLSIERDFFLQFLDDNPEVQNKLRHLLQERFMKKALSSNIVPFFQAIQLDRLMELSHHFVVEDTICTGDVILTPETYHTKFCIIICGSVEASDVVGDSKMATVLSPGSYFGTFAHFTHATTVEHTVVAKTPCVLFTCTRDVSNRILGTSPVVLAEIYIRWLRELVELKHVMQHHKARDFFLAFCRAEFSEENALFLIDLDTYMGIEAMGARREMALFLCETYISATAPKQVNIDHNMRESIINQIASLGLRGLEDEMEVELTVFEPARYEITRLVTKDSFPRFKRTKFFTEMLDAFAPYAHARHISLADAVNQFKEKIVLSPRDGARDDAGALFGRFEKIVDAVNLHKNRRTTLMGESQPIARARRSVSRVLADR
ncbi:hypothetical protein SPRG_08254 [Saprolegnia parasitica CBS 223.65]|uniref:Cyclic nucleotide-binding domain-containing protein n=2 Tax=Saprolegnia parasitica (strain CBS 223.65) TaxID=695850 RepID=A0A067CIR9_SAPPC|nr:hypothetical protein SPRG_08254 [Saprolegnia parasitica CBS 223.65]KDO26451.1 hypothetical protein SPRG_08254 [Saprolegnia parasitica CBS 223.65]|eukprot:XP_012202887.1 hypothetical protein SPRG_08254 [Saprolegnia parasitica CBS 223.65]